MGPENAIRTDKTMRKKNAGALFMDFHVSPEDRVGATPKKARGKSAPAKKQPRGARVEPRIGSIDSVYADDEPVPQGKPRRGKAKKARGGRRERKPLTLGRIFGKLFYLLFILGIWAGIAVAGVVVYFAMQMPSSDTWAVPERPANIRIVASQRAIDLQPRQDRRRGRLAARAALLRARRLHLHRGPALLRAFRHRPDRPRLGGARKRRAPAR